jgi:phosphoribosylformimino-5-aminoimidazole carboxamide ribotide isomerase
VFSTLNTSDAMLVIPAIDLRDGKCVRLAQGRSSEMQVYDWQPLDVAGRFVDSGAELIHVVDLDGAFAGHGSPNRLIVSELVKQIKVPVQFGGGIRSAEDIAELIDKGVSRVVLGTLATESPETLETIVERFGAAIAVAIDARDGRVMSRGWKQATEFSATELAAAVATADVKRIIYTDIGRDGMLSGVNIDHTNAVARASSISVIASGGIGSLDDLRTLREKSDPLVDSVIVGKALYEGRFTLGEAIVAAS